MNKYLIGFIGQGWIGKNYADNFERRGYDIVRYSLDEPYIQNKKLIKDCDFVFIAVPTPSTIDGFDDSMVRSAISLVGEGKVAIIKSTIIPGTTRRLHEEHPNIYVMHSPEFLTEATARHDVDNPERILIGIPSVESEYVNRAKEVITMLPDTSVSKIMKSEEAELYKYIRNGFLYSKVVFMNACYDMANSLDCSWEVIQEVMREDKWIGDSHINPVHKGGRGAGGNCFIKDMSTFIQIYENNVGDIYGNTMLGALQNKNNDLLLSSNKDFNILYKVHGEKS